MDSYLMSWVVFGLIILIPIIAQGKIMSAYNKYKKVKNSKGITGAEVARQILDNAGLEKVYVVEAQGMLSDHYDPTRKVVRLSKDIFHGESVASIAIAAHEVGHAIQDKESYGFLRFRSALVPIVNILNGILPLIILASFLLGNYGLIDYAIGIMMVTLLFQIVTLPVEFNASSRAKELVASMNLASGDENTGVAKMLSAAAMTYVASMLASMLEILRLLLLTNRD